MTCKRTQSDRGFSLIELMVSISIIGFLFIMVGSTYLNLFRIRNRIHSSIKSQQYVDQILYTMSEEAKWSDDFNISPGGSALTLIYTDEQEILYEFDTNQLNKTITDLSVDPPLVITDNLTPEEFIVDNFLVIQRSPNTQLPGFEVQLSVSNIPAGAGVTQSYTGQTAFTVRNRYQFVPTLTPTPIPGP